MELQLGGEEKQMEVLQVKELHIGEEKQRKRDDTRPPVKPNSNNCQFSCKIRPSVKPNSDNYQFSYKLFGFNITYHTPKHKFSFSIYCDNKSRKYNNNNNNNNGTVSIPRTTASS